MAKFVNLIAGSALIGAGLFLEFVTFGASTPLTAFLISAGIGMVITGIGTLLQKGPLSGTSTATRNPIAPWNVVYGRAKVGGTVVYFGYFGDNDKYLDLVIVLACHPCKSVDALLFDGQRIQIDPASGSSFTPLEQTVDIFHISRTNDIVTVVLHANIPLLQAGDDVIIQNVTGDKTLNGRYPVLQIISQVVGGPGSITFSYICGGAPAIVDLEGEVLTTWPDYRAKVHIEVLLGNHTATFPGMLTGTPYDGDIGNLVLNPNNPWGADHKLLGRTAVFLRLHYNDEVFANGLPAIGFHVSGKNDIIDLRTSPVTVAYTENSALCISDYLSNRVYGFKAEVGTEISYSQLIAAANLCDERVTLAGGGTESRYSLNGGFPLAMKRGEVLQNLLTSCGGRLTYSGGQFVIHPAGWPGVSFALAAGTSEGGPAGWTPRVSGHNNLGIATFDAVSTLPGIYSVTSTWPASCNVINWYALLAFPSSLTRDLLHPLDSGFVQGATNGTPYLPDFTTWSISFAEDVTPGNGIVVDVIWGAGYPLSACTVADSQGNSYELVFGSHTAGAATFLACFAALHTVGGPTTITVTNPSSLPFQSIQVAIHEYAGLSGQNLPGWLPFNTYSAGSSYSSPGEILDGSGHIQRVLVGGVSGATVPTWSPYGLTFDGTVHWSDLGPVPTPPGAFGGYTNTTGACSGVTAGSGPHVNSFTDTLLAGGGQVLHLISATLPYCADAVVSGGPPLPLGFLAVAAGPFRWRSKVSVRDLFNGVKGTYLCPGNKWQPSDIPPYAQDSLHGYANGSPLYPEGDANMAADGGDRRWLDIQLPFTISTSAAQRLAKIELMRRRQQGTGTFMFNMALYQTTALDVIQMSLPLLGWVDKLLEISAHRFKLDKVQTPGGEATLLGTEIDVQETDPSVYGWDPSEELSAKGYQQAVLPSNITVISNTHQEFLTDGAGNLIFANGDTITVLGVPN
jgi:hypothetical protein